MSTTVTQPVLVYHRIAQNRLKTVLLVAFALLSVVPFVGGISYGTADWFVHQFGHHADVKQIQAKNLKKALDAAAKGQRTAWTEEFDTSLAKAERQFEQEKADDEKLLWHVTILMACSLSAILGLLFWSIASSPVSNVLAFCGARPSGPSEAEARRLLENLSIGAGLPTPKLFVIDTPVPNAFAAGMNPASSVVAVTSGLLTLLDHRELEGVLAHELSHIGNRDTRLNTVVTSIALFLRLPYLIRQKSIQERRQGAVGYNPFRRRFKLAGSAAMLPIFIYIFFIAPFIAIVIRSAISRSREFLADADAALLTRFPEGLLRALAKIRGAGSVVGGANPMISHFYFADPTAPGLVMGLFKGRLLATHPPIEERINRLMEFKGGVPISVLESAAKHGAEFGKNHAPSTGVGVAATVARDELSVFTQGTPMGRVNRVLTATPLYDRPDANSPVLTNIAAGTLVIVFDDPGKFRQVLTHTDTFGYVPNTVKFKRVDMLPAEIYDPAARAAADKAQVAATQTATGLQAEDSKITGKQIAIAAAFGLVAFAGIFFVLIKFVG